MVGIVDKPIHTQFALDDYKKGDPGPRPIIGSMEITDGIRVTMGSITGCGVPFKGWWVDVYNVTRLLKRHRISSYRNLIKAIGACVVEEVCHYLGFIHSYSAHYRDLERTFIYNLHGFHIHNMRGWEFKWLFSEFTNKAEQT